MTALALSRLTLPVNTGKMNVRRRVGILGVGCSSGCVVGSGIGTWVGFI